MQARSDYPLTACLHLPIQSETLIIFWNPHLLQLAFLTAQNVLLGLFI